MQKQRSIMLSDPSMHQSFNLAGNPENLGLSVNQFGNSLTHSRGSTLGTLRVSEHQIKQTNKQTDKYNFLTRDLNVLK